MKILYSQIKELLPEIKAKPEEIINVFTFTGSMAEGKAEEVFWHGKKDYLISLEIRQNRPDCLSVLGLAKEIAAYYGFKTKLPSFSFSSAKGKKELEIDVKAKEGVKRILAIEIENLENKNSPEWLKDFLSFYDINSVNLAVDLSNYVMIFTGYPSHLFDLEKTKGQIYWSFNKKFKEIITLDGSVIKLNKNRNELIINDNEKILALAGIIGGKTAEISLETKSVLLEMAIYDSAIVRKNARDLKINTEANQRLSKNLSPAGIDFAMNFLISLLEKNCQGKITSQFFDYYPVKESSKKIILDPKSPSLFSGIDIPEKESIKILNNLGFKPKIENKKIKCTVPAERTDIWLEEDLVEEVVRMFGYGKIPIEELPEFEITKDITPDNIRLAEKIRDILSAAERLDEVFSCPLVKEGSNKEINYFDWQVVSTQNSVNEETPDLRQSLAVGLINQFREYLKKNVEHIGIFEMGKVFGKVKNNNYQEKEVVGILKQSSLKKKGLPELKKTTENLLRLLGLIEITYRQSTLKPSIANPYSCWDIFSQEKFIGIIYKLNLTENKNNVYFIEIDLNQIIEILKKIKNKSAVELTEKLVTLDANIELSQKESIDKFLTEIKNKIGQKNIWSLEITDKFILKEKKVIKYTVRVSYLNLSDSEAKKIHLKSFNLR
jgi:phenylalanyl-tRNA synthetase beta chain